MHRVAILVNPPIPFFELGCALEVFALPRPEFRNWYETDTVSFDTGPQDTNTDVAVLVHKVTSLMAYDTVIVPGWDTHSRKIRLSVAQEMHEFVASGKRLVSFCSGAFLLAQLGLLNGKRATTHWRYAERFKARFPEVSYEDNVLFTREGNLACSAGSAAALDLSLDIVREDFGYEAANSVARRLVISPQRQGGQAQFVETPMQEHANGFAETLDWILSNLDKPLVVDDLAGRANMSRRSFDRHFRASLGLSPKAWLNQQRILRAKSILESTSPSMEQLAQQVGYDNAITLRFNFNKYVGISPTQYQAQFGRNN